MHYAHVYLNGAFDLGVEEESYISHSIKPLQKLLHD